MMTSTTWDPKYNTGISVIDWQHKTILSAIENIPIINRRLENNYNQRDRRIYDEPEEDGLQKLLIDSFDFLYFYWADHIESEEKFMALQFYPEKDYLHHKLSHVKLFKTLFALRKDITNKQITSNELKKILEHLFISHIINEDFKYAMYLNKEI